MGGVLSCVRLGHRDKKSQESQTKPSQNEDTDDNFTILPSSAERKNTANDDVTYENVSKTSLMNYEPKTRHADEIKKQNGVGVTSSSPHGDGAQESLYVNCSVTSQQQPQQLKSSSSERPGGHKTSSNMNPANEIKEKKKKSKNPKAPPTKPKKKLFKVKEEASTAVTGEEGSDSKGKGKQLTYIEVEFASPPPSATSVPKNNGGKSSPTSDPSSSTTYSDVVNEGGRLVLIT